jgi:hypothetical protein
MNVTIDHFSFVSLRSLLGLMFCVMCFQEGSFDDAADVDEFGKVVSNIY